MTGEDIERFPTVARSLNDIARLDPRVTIFDRESGAISAGGQNNRYNSILIDGVPTNDTFGLNANGLPSLKQPIALDAIDQINVEISPYDVTRSGFTGASINAVTKSGTNTFSGSLYAYYRNEKMISDTLDGQDSPIADFTERTMGLTFGGPIRKDRLFFFLSYETVSESRLPPVRRFTPTPEILAFLQAVSREYGFEAGELETSDLTLKDDKILLKVDWNINPFHRLSVRYNNTRGENPIVSFYEGTSSTSLSSHWYTDVQDNTGYVAELFSRWTDDFSTRARLSFSEYEKLPDLAGNTPEITIRGIPGLSGTDNGTIRMGTHRSRHTNELRVRTTIFQVTGDYLLGDHTLTAGVNVERVENYNDFLQQSRGIWEFNNRDAFREAGQQTGMADTYQLQFVRPGERSAADWTLNTVALYLQDTWVINPQLKVVGGVRIDIPMASDPIRENPAFERAFGIPNTTNIDGNYVIQPRLGFNYALDKDRRTQIRGGFGLFYGSTPGVWLSNPYTNNGMTTGRVTTTGSATPLFTADGSNQPIPSETPVRSNVDVLSGDFEMPSVWKSNLALDHKLPFWDLNLTVEAQFSWTNNDIHYEHLNLLQNAEFPYLPDGRMNFRNREREDGFAEVLLLRNTNLGKSANYTFSIDRNVRRGLSFRMGYTYGSATNVSDGSQAVAFSTWNQRPIYNPNEEVESRSRYEVRHRFLANVRYTFEAIRKNPTTISLVYDGRTGRPFSYVFGNDVNTDRVPNINPDLVYMPSGPDDPLVRFANPVQEAAFWEWASGQEALMRNLGQVVPRNAGRAPWVHQFDLSLTQEVRIYRDHRIELTFTMENIGNLLNKKWGIERQAQFPGIVEAATASFDRARNQYVYSNPFNRRDDFTPTRLSSRWAALVGVRYRF